MFTIKSLTTMILPCLATNVLLTDEAGAEGRVAPWDPGCLVIPPGGDRGFHFKHINRSSCCIYVLTKINMYVCVYIYISLGSVDLKNHYSYIILYTESRYTYRSTNKQHIQPAKARSSVQNHTIFNDLIADK